MRPKGAGRDAWSRSSADNRELRMRFGLNSGPVTAGVFRGERSHFQLFGDTVVRKQTWKLVARFVSPLLIFTFGKNTAARMERYVHCHSLYMKIPSISTLRLPASSVAPDKVHVSASTAALLKQCGKGHCVSKRKDFLQIKRKGILGTFFSKSRGGSGRWTRRRSIFRGMSL